MEIPNFGDFACVSVSTAFPWPSLLSSKGDTGFVVVVYKTL